MNPATSDSFSPEKHQYAFNIGTNENINPPMRDEELLEDDFDFGEEGPSSIDLDDIDSMMKDVSHQAISSVSSIESKFQEESIFFEETSTAKEFHEELSAKEENVQTQEQEVQAQEKNVQLSKKELEKADVKTLNLFGIKEIKTKKDINNVMNRVKLFNNKNELIESHGHDIPHVQNQLKNRRVAFVDINDKKLHVPKKMMKHLGPTHKHFDHETGKHVELTVVEMTNQLFKEFTQILTVCFQVHNQLQAMEKQNQNTNTPAPIAVTPRVPLRELNIKVAERSKEHVKLFKNKISLEKKEHCPVGSHIVSNRNKKQKEIEKKNKESHDINVREIKRGTDYWNKQMESILGDFLKHGQRSHFELLQDLNEVIQPIHNWDNTAEKQSKFEQIMDHHHANHNEIDEMIAILDQLHTNENASEDKVQLSNAIKHRLTHFVKVASHKGLSDK